MTLAPLHLEVGDNMANEIEGQKVQSKEPYPKVQFPPSDLDDFMNRQSSKASSNEAPPDLKRKVSIIIPPEMCIPGAFKRSFKLTLQELNSRSEIIAFREIGGISLKRDGNEAMEDEVHPQAMAVAFGKASIILFNGRRMTRVEKEQVWEALGMTGRLAVGTAYIKYCTGSDDDVEDLLGNCLATAELEM